MSPEEGVWSLSHRPSELLGELEEHVGRLTEQLGTVTSDLMGTAEDSVTVQLLSRCVDCAKTAASLAWYVTLSLLR